MENFSLSIEDTDRQRSTDAAIDAIMESMKWLELDWEGDPVFQFSRADRHKEIAQQLLETGKAYKCYCTPEEIAAMREKAKAEGGIIGYDGTWRDKSDANVVPGTPFVVRFKSPNDGETIIKDQVQGDVTFKNKELDDLILLRSDGTPTYMLSVVVDDHDMSVSHIIRGDDHLTNAARQSQIYQALGWEIPVFAHIPLIHGPDGAKLSKRHGALGAETYRKMGFLHNAMQNYLLRLGWSHGDEEIFNIEQVINWFNIDGIGKSPSRFDIAKLKNINAHYIRDANDTQLVEKIKDIWNDIDEIELQNKEAIPDNKWLLLETAMYVLKERAETLIDLIQSAQFIFTEKPLVIENKAQKKLNEEAISHLKNILPLLENDQEWSLESVEEILSKAMSLNTL